MIWGTREENIPSGYTPQPYYAWRPVRLNCGRYAWMEWIWYKPFGYDIGLRSYFSATKE